MTAREFQETTDPEGGMPATARADAAFVDPLAALSVEGSATLAAIAGQLIPAAHGMPSAAAVVTEARLTFVLRARPDLLEPLRSALRPELGSNVDERLARLAEEPTNLAALQLAIVAGYYTDKGVRDLIGYPGQMAIEVKSWQVPEYLEDGLIDAMLARGPVWRDPRTGKRAVLAHQPRTYAERFTNTAVLAEGGSDGRDRG